VVLGIRNVTLAHRHWEKTSRRGRKHLVWELSQEGLKLNVHSWAVEGARMTDREGDRGKQELPSERMRHRSVLFLHISGSKTLMFLRNTWEGTGLWLK
jgi:hypothetical protein